MTKVNVNQYLFEYQHEGAEWAIQIPATSAEDAHARLKKLAWAKYRGEVHSTYRVPSTFLGGLVARIITWWFNLTRK